MDEIQITVPAPEELVIGLGPSGPAGAKGDKGDKGDTGPKGADGLTQAVTSLTIGTGYYGLSSPLTGDITLMGGPGISLSTSGNEVTISNSGIATFGAYTYGGDILMDSTGHVMLSAGPGLSITQGYPGAPYTINRDDSLYYFKSLEQVPLQYPDLNSQQYPIGYYSSIGYADRIFIGPVSPYRWSDEGMQTGDTVHIVVPNYFDDYWLIDYLHVGNNEIQISGNGLLNNTPIGTVTSAPGSTGYVKKAGVKEFIEYPLLYTASVDYSQGAPRYTVSPLQKGLILEAISNADTRGNFTDIYKITGKITVNFINRKPSTDGLPFKLAFKALFENHPDSTGRIQYLDINTLSLVNPNDGASAKTTKNTKYFSQISPYIEAEQQDSNLYGSATIYFDGILELNLNAPGAQDNTAWMPYLTNVNADYLRVEDNFVQITRVTPRVSFLSTPLNVGTWY